MVTDIQIPVGFKLTDIGIIPEDWDVKELGEIGECIIGLTYKPENVKEDGLLVLRSSNISDSGLVFDNNVYVNIKVKDRLIVREGDLLICVRNGSRPLIGKCALINKKVEGNTFGAFMSVFRTDASKYVYYQFISACIKRQINENIGATINQITNKNLNSFRIPIPQNEKEVDNIVDVLENIEQLVIKLEELIEKKRFIKQGTMHELLTGKRRLPGFNGEWKECILSDIGEFSKGKGIRKDEVVDEGVPCIRYGEIYTHYNDYIRKFYSFIPRNVAKQSQRLKKGALLFTGSGETSEGIGKCVAFLGEEEAYAGGDIVIFMPSGHDSMYLGYLMNHASISIQKARLGQGDAVVHISSKKLGQLQLHLPNIQEQHSIATVLSELDSEIDALEQKRDKTILLKEGVMQQLLTGRVRLT